MKTLLALVTISCLVIACNGCQSQPSAAESALTNCQDKIAELTSRVEKLEKENQHAAVTRTTTLKLIDELRDATRHLTSVTVGQSTELVAAGKERKKAFGYIRQVSTDLESVAGYLRGTARNKNQ